MFHKKLSSFDDHEIINEHDVDDVGHMTIGQKLLECITFSCALIHACYLCCRGRLG